MIKQHHTCALHPRASDNLRHTKPVGPICLVTVLLIAHSVTALDVAVPYVQADFMWAQGYTGQGIDIGVIDLFRADRNHPAISGNWLGFEQFVNGAAFISAHATQVTGAAVSQDATRKGVAPDAGWWTAQTTNPSSRSNQRRQTRAAETFAHYRGVVPGRTATLVPSARPRPVAWMKRSAIRASA